MFTCKFCDYKGFRSDFEGDHEPPISRLIPLPNIQVKIQLICSGCNRQKGNKTDGEYILWRIFNPNFINYGPLKR